MQLDTGWLVAGLMTIITSVTGALVKVYYGQIKAKDDQIAYQQGIIDRLMDAQESQSRHQAKQASVSERAVEFLERERERIPKALK